MFSEGLTPPQRSLYHYIERLSDDGEHPPTIREICGHFGYRSTKAAVDHLNALEKKGIITRERKCARGIKLLRRENGIPLLGSIPAGKPGESVGELVSYLPLSAKNYGIRDRAAAYALRVVGDSMLGRHLVEGDIVVLEHGASPCNGDIVAALIDNESTLKTLILRKGKVWLRAENPRYPSLIPAWDLQIQGVARAVLRRL